RTSLEPEPTMHKTVTATGAKNKFGSLVNWVVENSDEVIVENHGEPAVVLISVSEYEGYKAFREVERRKRLLAELTELRKRVRERNPDITTDEQAFEIADEIVRDAIDSLVAKGKIRFAADNSADNSSGNS
ncbi:MAG TPA: type II toxin-antitoxin system prevent-host-death family antitoxin, partial [Chloroflexia bacterium]|nr:type II toxin-antitoxin system prevent-host-death family antitoxin [Chloroflexia bacterium]